MRMLENCRLIHVKIPSLLPVIPAHTLATFIRDWRHENCVSYFWEQCMLSNCMHSYTHDNRPKAFPSRCYSYRSILAAFNCDFEEKEVCIKYSAAKCIQKSCASLPTHVNAWKLCSHSHPTAMPSRYIRADQYRRPASPLPVSRR